MRKQHRSRFDFRMVLATGLVFGASQVACELELPAEPQAEDVEPTAAAAAADSARTADQFSGLAPIGAYNSAATGNSLAVPDQPVRPKIIACGPSGAVSGPQPLIVVDGVIINTFTCGPNSTNCLSTTADLAVEDIKSIEVVKAREAIARFGEQARGGVVVITTNRSGR